MAEALDRAAIRVSSVAELRERAADLIRKNGEEAALDIPDIDWARYEACEEKGITCTLAAWLDGRIVGYSIVFVTPHMHCQTKLIGQVDTIYVSPECRSFMSKRLVSATREMARSNGAKRMYWHAKPGTGLDALLRNMRLIEHVYAEDLQ